MVLTVLSTFPPVRCGLATYSEDLIAALRRADARLQIERLAIAMVGEPSPARVSFVIKRADPSSYAAAARMLRDRGVSVALIQHEFKIYGGRYGCLVLDLINRSSCPVITILHTVPRRPRGRRLDVLLQICRGSAAVVTHSTGSREIVKAWGVDDRKIFAIPHGAPRVSFRRPPSERSGTLVFLSYGHLRRSKGYEVAIDALAALHRRGLRFDYLIYGKDHPRRRGASAYRAELLSRIEQVGLEHSVRLVETHLTNRELAKVVQGCDVGLLPYTRKEQSSSGTLGFFLACGRPVICSTFRFASDVLDRRCGLLFDVGDAAQLSRAILKMARQPELRTRMARRAYEVARPWRWDAVAPQYVKLVRRVLSTDHERAALRFTAPARA